MKQNLKLKLKLELILELNLQLILKFKLKGRRNECLKKISKKGQFAGISCATSALGVTAANITILRSWCSALIINTAGAPDLRALSSTALKTMSTSTNRLASCRRAHALQLRTGARLWSPSPKKLRSAKTSFMGNARGIVSLLFALLKLWSDQEAVGRALFPSVTFSFGRAICKYRHPASSSPSSTVEPLMKRRRIDLDAIFGPGGTGGQVHWTLEDENAYLRKAVADLRKRVDSLQVCRWSSSDFPECVYHRK
ncbi:unnamed protein product [Nesidiocoris tenuis]|uniref:Uncharacterized protein n=1 Tax=Nesidiocoris tenuis TaxID=355587 RepID=A0A6H5GA66_9HEMI|nr:unnamed protein product [Nesidiocoris tenuis]